MRHSRTAFSQGTPALRPNLKFKLRHSPLFPLIPKFAGNRVGLQSSTLSEFDDPAPRNASCIEGGRARPPEDVGGVHGYADFLDIIADPGPEHRETKRWAGGHFDPEWFDREMTDKDVRNALRANRRIRLHQPRPKTRTRSS